jgi:hypothetical protein
MEVMSVAGRVDAACSSLEIHSNGVSPIDKESREIKGTAI